MKTKNLKQSFMMALFALTVMSAQARSWRINNDTNKKAHFTNINAAMSSNEVVAGDTLYLDPGTIITTTQSITKQVTVVGTGYFLQNETHPQATIKANIEMRAASSKLEGVNVDGIIYICANKITVERCFFRNVNWGGTGQYATIRQCYSTGDVYGYGSTDNRSASCTIENCILIRGSYCINYLYCPIIRNNYLKCTSNAYVLYNISSGTIVNNIIINTSKPQQCLNNVSDVLLKNNVLSGTNDATINITGVTAESSIFALEGTNDQLYRLKEDSPAKGAATDGGDCGPYSGLYPYVPSGYPLGMPRFESSSVPVRPQDGQVHITQKVVLQGE